MIQSATGGLSILESSERMKARPYKPKPEYGRPKLCFGSEKCVFGIPSVSSAVTSQATGKILQVFMILLAEELLYLLCAFWSAV